MLVPTDFSAGEREHGCAAEDLRLKIGDFATEPQEAGFEFVDGDVAVAGVVFAAWVAGQDEVVHAADAA